MNKYLVFLYIFIFSFIGCTTEHAIETTEQQQANDQVKMQEAVEAFNQAMIEPDAETFSKLISSSLSYGHSGGTIQNKAEFLEDIVNGSFKFLNPSNEDQTIEIVGNNAIVRHVFTSKITNKGEAGELRIGNLQVWVKEEGEWKLLARQAYKI